MEKGIHNKLMFFFTSLLAGSKILSAGIILMSYLNLSFSYGSVGSNTVSNYTFAVFSIDNDAVSKIDTGFALEIVVLSFFIMAGLYFLQKKQKPMAMVSAAGIVAHVGLWLYFL